MSDEVIRIEGLGKRYYRGRWVPYRTLRDALTRAASAPFRWLAGRKASAGISPLREVWALRDVHLSVRRGEAIGIIGRNGAGKSTLLKILSRITDPTEGRAEVRGRVRALLEVGTGFHAELTGRENIFLNGGILGMKRREIERRFDDIVAFSEVSEFLDTPVKHYSSGMYVRLAFAVAAHLEPEILIVDEVLAVGDLAFQKKCLGKMEEVARAGRTVLFVSHNLGTVRQLCQRVIWFEEGRVRLDGASGWVVSQYMEAMLPQVDARSVLIPRGGFSIDRVVIRNGRGEPGNEFTPGDPLEVEIHYTAKDPLEEPHIWFVVSSSNGPSFGASTFVDGQSPRRLEGPGILRCRFPSLPLSPHLYHVRMGARDRSGHEMLVRSGDVASFRVVALQGDREQVNHPTDQDGWSLAAVRIPHQWSVESGAKVS